MDTWDSAVLATLPYPWLVCGASDHLSPNFTCLTMENGAILDHNPQMLLVCEHMAEPEIAFTIWAVPVMVAAETALPSLLNLPKVQVPALASPGYARCLLKQN